MNTKISFSELNGVPGIIKDYLSQEKSLQTFYDKSFSVENLIFQAKEKLQSYKNRGILVQSIEKQLHSLDLSQLQKENLEKLQHPNTVTITTGHQLNLMTGPLYFVYKILHVIKLCNSMNERQKEINFVPVFWMATEDHDFEEINHFHFQNKTITWEENHKDFVGNIEIDNALKESLKDFYEELKYFPEGKQLRKFITDSYFSQKTLSEATQILVHNLFKEYGLLMIDGNDKNLKKLFIPYLEKEITQQLAYRKVSETISAFNPNYKIQVNPRKINLFYHDDKERNRIDELNGKYYILGTCKNFTRQEIQEEIQKTPEKFSPNALLRPVYQEVILPNVAYIGGNAEISYWLELKSYFDENELAYPILIPRNSFLLLTENQKSKLGKFGLEVSDIYLPKDKLTEKIVEKISTLHIPFDTYQSELENIFNRLLQESKFTHISWKNMILAQEKKQLKGFQKIQKRLKKSEKLNHHQTVSNFDEWYYEIFPKGKWQERVENFSYFYALKGKDFISQIYQNLQEFDSCLIITDI